MMGDEAEISGDFAERLVTALGEIPQAVVAKRAGVSTTSMSKYVRGAAEPQLMAAYRIAKALGVSFTWLATGEGAPHLKGAGFVGVPIYDVMLAAGTAAFADAGRVIGEMPFDLDLLLQFCNRPNASGLGVLEAEGDSMEPTIADGARVVVDFMDTRLRESVFAFRLGDELRLKRLRRTIDGVEIISDNSRYQPERLVGDRLEHFAIIGRALWAGAPI